MHYPPNKREDDCCVFQHFIKPRYVTPMYDPISELRDFLRQLEWLTCDGWEQKDEGTKLTLRLGFHMLP
jgi:hypothetical protein